jgi:hypothetical protein
VDRLVLIVGAVVVAGLVAGIVQRRRPARPTAPTATVPRQLDRNDFVQPATTWLVAVFTADTCRTCAGVWSRARELAGPDVAVQELEVRRDRVLHERYEVDSVPLLLIADSEGVVVRWFLGPVPDSDLESAAEILGLG